MHPQTLTSVLRMVPQVREHTVQTAVQQMVWIQMETAAQRVPWEFPRTE